MAKKENSKIKNTEKAVIKTPFIYSAFFQKYYPFILLLIIFAVYFSVIGFGFVYCDDHDIVLKNFERLRHLSNIPQEFFKGYLTTDYYRPMINLSFILDAQISEKEAYFYHFTNIVLHFLACFLIYRLILKLDFDKKIAILASLIFAVHPLFTNAVAWLPGRNDMLFTIFLLSSFLCLLHYLNNKKYSYLIFHFIFFLLSLLSKETALVFPFVLIIYFLLLNKEKLIFKNYMIIFGGLVISTGIFFLFRSFATLGKPVYSSGFHVFENLATIPDIIGKFFIPAGLSVLPTFSSFNTILGLIFIAGLTATIVFLKKRRLNYVFFGILWFLISVIPGLFVQLLDVRDWNEYLECRAYFPMIGILIVLAEILSQKLVFNKKSLIIIAITIIILSTLTMLESRNYKDAKHFYQAAVKSNSDKARFHEILATIYVNDNQLDLAEHELKESIRSNPFYGLNYYNLGSFYYVTKKYSQAAKAFESAVKLRYKETEMYEPLAFSYFKEGNSQKAMEYAKKAIQNNPESFESKKIMFLLYAKLENFAGIENFTAKLTQNGKNREEISTLLNDAAVSLLRASKDKPALKILNQAAEIDPKNIKPVRNLMTFYFYIEKDYDLAKEYAEKLIRLGGKLSPEVKKKLNL